MSLSGMTVWVEPSGRTALQDVGAAAGLAVRRDPGHPPAPRVERRGRDTGEELGEGGRRSVSHAAAAPVCPESDSGPCLGPTSCQRLELGLPCPLELLIRVHASEPEGAGGWVPPQATGCSVRQARVPLLPSGPRGATPCLWAAVTRCPRPDWQSCWVLTKRSVGD